MGVQHGQRRTRCVAGTILASSFAAFCILDCQLGPASGGSTTAVTHNADIGTAHDYDILESAYHVGWVRWGVLGQRDEKAQNQASKEYPEEQEHVNERLCSL